jgi:hypothetical protein
VTKLPKTTLGNDTIVTIIDGLMKPVRWFAMREINLLAKKFAHLFINNYIYLNGISIAVVFDRDV